MSSAAVGSHPHVLARADVSPVIEPNRAVAVAMDDGPMAGLGLIDNHPGALARAALCRRLWRTAPKSSPPPNRLLCLSAPGTAEKDGERWRAWLPRYERGNGLVWRREDRIDRGHDPTHRAFRMRLLGTRPATAIDPSSDTVAEGLLRETECMNTRWREEDRTTDSLVALAGYVLLRAGAPELRAVEAVAVGGDTRYGLGRLQRIQWTEASRVFGRAVKLEDAEPSIESDFPLAHADAPGDLNGRIRGQREALGGWDYGKRGVQRIAGALWMPGSRLDSARPWILASKGLWRVPKPEVAP